MALVTLRIAGREHQVACRDGEELHLRRVAALADSQSESAMRASGGDPQRTLLLLVLLLADQLDEAQRNPSTGVSPVLLEHVADRLEAVAAALEEEPSIA
jgi:cell division protein ZapA